MTGTSRRDQVAASHDPAAGCCSLTTSPGDLVVQRRDDPTRLDGYPAIRILRADPKIWISGEMLEQMLRSGVHPAVTVDDDVLRIDAENLTAVYRLTHYCHPRDIWTAEWPD